MLHPSYTELMEKINQENQENDEPVINSRYSIVIASAKRAREIISGKSPLLTGMDGEKPLSIAVKELYGGQISIASEGDENEVALLEETNDMVDAEETAEVEEIPVEA